MTQRKSRWILGIALTGLASLGLGGGGTLPLKMGGEANPVNSGSPVLASVQIEANPAVPPTISPRGALEIKAACARAGLRYESERGTFIIGSTVYSITGVCANLASDDGSREIYAASTNSRVRVGDARLTGAQGSRVLVGNLYETRNNVEVRTFVVTLKELN